MRLLYHVDALGGYLILVSPSGRPLAVERGPRTEAMPDAQLLVVGLSCLQKLGPQACIGHDGALLLSVRGVEAEPVRRRSGESPAREPDA